MPYNTFPTFAGMGWDIKKKPMFSTSSDMTASGARFSTSYWSIPHFEFFVPFNFLSQADRDAMEAFYIQQLGPGIPFLLAPTNDSAFVDKNSGNGNASNLVFQVPLPAQAQVVSTDGLFVTDYQGKTLQYTTPRTNLLLQSQTYDNASWSKNAAAITANAAAAPDGFVTGDLLKEDATAAGHYASQGAAVANGVQYTFTTWAKETGSGSKRYLTLVTTSTGFGAAQLAVFDCSGTGAVTTTSGGATATITKVGSWYRCVMTTIAATSSTTASLQVRLTNSSTSGASVYTGDNTSGLYVWGSQFEAGMISTSYIATTTATVTDNGYTITAFGLITFSVPPRNGAAVLWSGSYAYLVNFKDDAVEFNQFMSQFYEQKGITFRTYR